MLNKKVLLLVATGLLFSGFAYQPAFAVEKAKVIKPLKVSRLTLAKLLMSRSTNRFHRYFMLEDMATTTSPIAAVSTNTSAKTVSHSETNIQVQGVDESDSVKVSDNGYIYQIYNNQVRVIKGFPIADISQSTTLNFPDTNFYPTGLYVQNNKLVVLGNSWQNLPQTTSSKMAVGWWFWNTYSQTRVLVYDVSNPDKPQQERDVAIDGDYLDSRRIGDDVFFITRTYPHYYMYGDTTANLKLADMLPTIVDTKSGKTTKKLLPLSDISYFPNFVEPDYVIAASINTVHPEQAINTKAYLGAGELIYASTQNLYLSASKYHFNSTGDIAVGNVELPTTNKNTVTTQLFKFAIQNGQLNFTAAGEVPGTALNQFSMDENGDYFRIATTTQNWFNNNNKSYNSLFVLNKDMKTVGKIDSLAEGEQIYSTRFLGDRCYIVTFRLVDPLFAIDLSTPTNPTVMGELKIPGYSNYLHPYDETHLIGFGKDAAVYQSEQPNSDQFWAGGSAFYQGLKVALFDVADMKNPKELYSVTIGDRGSNSPLLWNHKALYWDSERHLFGFPVELYQLPNGFNPKEPWQYGLTSYQGAYIYEVTPEKGFNLKAKLTHIPDSITPIHITGENYEYNYWDWTTYDLFIDRMIRIDNSLYTLSNKQMNVYDLNDYQQQGSLMFNP